MLRSQFLRVAALTTTIALKQLLETFALMFVSCFFARRACAATRLLFSKQPGEAAVKK